MKEEKKFEDSKNVSPRGNESQTSQEHFKKEIQ